MTVTGHTARNTKSVTIQSSSQSSQQSLSNHHDTAYMKPPLQTGTFLLLTNFNIPTQQRKESYLKVVTPRGGNAFLLKVI